MSPRVASLVITMTLIHWALWSPLMIWVWWAAIALPAQLWLSYVAVHYIGKIKQAGLLE